MLPGDTAPWAIIAAVCLAVAMGVVFTKYILRAERPAGPGDSDDMHPAAGGWRAPKRLERRRSARLLRCIRVFAYSHAPGESPFYEEATTSEVSSHGGLLTLAANVCVGQKLLLTNMASQEERECHVVRFTRKHHQKGDVAIEFTQSAPDFWQPRTERPIWPISGAWSSR